MQANQVRMNEIDVDSETTGVSDHCDSSYTSPSADIVLLSDDGVRFRVHSSVLATASKFFHDMFRMPRLAAEHDDALPMGESSEIVKTLLDIIYPRATDPVLPCMSFAFVRRLLVAAEKYDLARVHHYIRLLILTKPFLSKPLEVYSLACMFGWPEDAHRISWQTLNLDLSSPVHADILKSLDSASLFKLFQVRWKIKEEVMEAMEVLKRTHENDEWGCDCGSNLLDDEEWDCLHRLIRGELDKCPDGSSLRQQRCWSDGGLAVWNLKCIHCDQPIVQESMVKAAVVQALDKVFHQMYIVNASWIDLPTSV